MEKFCPERLISIRNMIGISTEEAAHRVGVSVSRYEKYESGEVVPPVAMVHVLALYLGTSEAYLNGRTAGLVLKKPAVFHVTLGSADILGDYNRLDPDQRRMILEVIHEMLEN